MLISICTLSSSIVNIILFHIIRYLRRVICLEEWSTFSPAHVTTSQNICLNIKILMPCGILVQQPDHDLSSTPVLSTSRGPGWTLVWPGTGVTRSRVRVRSSSIMPHRSRMSGSPWVTSLQTNNHILTKVTKNYYHFLLDIKGLKKN